MSKFSTLDAPTVREYVKRAGKRTKDEDEATAYAAARLTAACQDWLNSPAEARHAHERLIEQLAAELSFA